MLFVPVVPSQPVQPPSPRTRELAGLLSKVLDEYTKAHPNVSSAEVREAIRMAQMSAGPNRSAVAGILAGTLALGVGVLLMGVLFLRGGGGGIDMEGSMPMIVIAIIAFLGILVAMVKVASR